MICERPPTGKQGVCRMALKHLPEDALEPSAESIIAAETRMHRLDDLANNIHVTRAPATPTRQ
jgi:hypothetical protein